MLTNTILFPRIRRSLFSAYISTNLSSSSHLDTARHVHIMRHTYIINRAGKTARHIYNMLSHFYVYILHRITTVNSYSVVYGLSDCSKYFTLHPQLVLKVLYTSPPIRTVHCNPKSTSLGSIQPCCSYYANILVHISTTVCSQVLIFTAE